MRAILRAALLAVNSLAKSNPATQSANNYEKNIVKLYRGVPADHVDFELAKRGIVLPQKLFGHTDPSLHNAGFTKSSRLTSWTKQRQVAEIHAGQNGIVLTKQFLPKQLVVGFDDPWLEQEIMVKGVVNGAYIDLVSKLNTDITSTMEETKRIIHDLPSNTLDSDKRAS
jgi:hypothetical protein